MTDNTSYNGPGAANDIPPRFEPRSTDPFVKPELQSLVTYLWTDNEELGKDYRTGVLVDKKDTIRFYDGPDESGAPIVQEHRFGLTKKMFREGKFRARDDLLPGYHCYDHVNEKWCTLVEIVLSDGGVRVQYDGSASAVLISADDLVGAGPANSNRKRSVTPDATVMNQSKKNRPEASPKQWYGVFEGVDQEGQYYIRGLLRESDDQVPWLVAGERVRYSDLPGDTNTQMLELDSRTQQYLEVLPKGKIRATYERYLRFARKAEINYAKEALEEAKAQRRLYRSTSLDLRPLQPVQVHPFGQATEAVVIEQDKDRGWIKVEYEDSSTETLPFDKVKLLGYEPEKIDLQNFFRENAISDKQSSTYQKDPDYLVRAWREKNGEEKSKEFEKNFERLLHDRAHRRELMGAGENGSRLTVDVMQRLENRTTTLLTRLRQDFQLDRNVSGMDSSMFKSRITEVKNMNPYPNLLLLCGGFAPEVIAHKRLPGAAKLGTVIIQDVDLVAIGVAVAANPDVNFAIAIDDPDDPKYEPGDVRILSSKKLQLVREMEVRVGGIHSVHITNPCQSFSLAGSKQGFKTDTGQLLLHCVNIVNSINKTSDMPMYLAENVPSMHSINEEFDSSLPDCDAAYFYADASMCSPCKRNRKFATNRPPVKCAEGPGPRGPDEPPSLNGDLPEYSAQIVVKQGGDRMVHPELKKFPCLTHSGPKGDHIWQRRGEYEEPLRSPMTPDEAERAMGYLEHEIGVTRLTAAKAVRKRIQEHNYKRDGCLVPLKGCADDSDGLLEPVSDTKRLQLLGNSQVVTVLEALTWNDRRLFPAAAAATTAT